MPASACPEPEDGREPEGNRRILRIRDVLRFSADGVTGLRADGRVQMTPGSAEDRGG
jgi:hypothetical protein